MKEVSTLLCAACGSSLFLEEDKHPSIIQIPKTVCFMPGVIRTKYYCPKCKEDFYTKHYKSCSRCFSPFFIGTVDGYCFGGCSNPECDSWRISYFLHEDDSCVLSHTDFQKRPSSYVSRYIIDKIATTIEVMAVFDDKEIKLGRSFSALYTLLEKVVSLQYQKSGDFFKLSN